MTKKKAGPAAKQPATTTISNCHIQTGVQWDGQAVEAVHTVAAALLENAKAAHALAAVFASQNIQLAPAIVIGQAT